MMSNLKLTGPSLAAVLIVIAICVTVIELGAMHYGIDGVAFSTVIAGLVGLACLATGRALPHK